VRGGLHDEERCPQVDGDVSVEEFDGGVQQRSTRSETRGVDDAINPTVAVHGSSNSTGGCLRIGKINSVELGVCSVMVELSGKGLTCYAIAPGDHDPGRTRIGSCSGDPGAQPSIFPADQDDLARKKVFAHRDLLSERSRLTKSVPCGRSGGSRELHPPVPVPHGHR